MQFNGWRPWRTVLATLPILALAGCWSEAPRTVIVYAALDREFSAPVLQTYASREGVQVVPKYDVESTKTVGLTMSLMAEADRPRCDVFWNNEILNTLRLAERGLLEPYVSTAAAPYPAAFRDPAGLWHGFAARARVLVINTSLASDENRPQSILDLADPKWRGRCGMAKPLFGTTATHAACLFAAWGDDRATAWFQDLKRNEVQILSGNKQVAIDVANGRLAFGLTDTDDGLMEIAKGMPVAIVYPDQGSEGIGTLFIPNTLAIVKGCPHPEEARKLVDYLLSAEVEGALAAGESGQIPLNPNVPAPDRVRTPDTVKAMAVDFSAASAAWDRAAEVLRELFTD